MRVKLESNPDLGVRKVSIKLSNHENKVVGPLRMVNSTEKRYLDKLKAIGIQDVDYEEEISEARKRFDKEELQSLIISNKSFIKNKDQILKTLPKGNKLAMFRPQIEINKNTGLPFEVNDKENDALMDLGFWTNSQFIVISEPSLNCDIKDYQKRMNSSREKIISELTLQKGNFIAVPTIDCRNQLIDSAVERAKAIVDDGYEFVNVVCGSINNIITIKRVTETFKDKDIFAFGTEIPKVIGRKRPISGPHFFQTLGLNAVSTLLPNNFNPKGISPHDIPIRKIRRFDRFEGAHLFRGEHQILHGEELLCNCPMCAKENLTSFYEKHIRKRGATAVKCKIHEVFSSLKEFKESINYIGDMLTYFKSRRALYEGLYSKGFILAPQLRLFDF